VGIEAVVVTAYEASTGLGYIGWTLEEYQNFHPLTGGPGVEIRDAFTR
jgi:hypothetical protein